MLSYVLINRAGESHFGIPREQMIGKTSEDVFPDGVGAAIAAARPGAAGHRQANSSTSIRSSCPAAAAASSPPGALPIRDKHGEPGYLLTVIEDVTDRKRAEAQIAQLAHHDPLTDLPNRDRLQSMLRDDAGAGGQVRAKASPCCASISTASRRSTTCSGIRSATPAARGGGSPERDARRRVPGPHRRRRIRRHRRPRARQPTQAARLAERMLAAVADDFEIDGHRLRIGLSIGIAALIRSTAPTRSSLLGNADAALYRAKADGRGSIRFFEADMDQQLRERRALQQDLRAARRARRARPRTTSRRRRIDGEIVGFEALVRWQHPHARHDLARRVHPARRGKRADHADRRMDPARGLPRGGVLAEAAA